MSLVKSRAIDKGFRRQFAFSFFSPHSIDCRESRSSVERHAFVSPAQRLSSQPKRSLPKPIFSFCKFCVVSLNPSDVSPTLAAAACHMLSKRGEYLLDD